MVSVVPGDVSVPFAVIFMRTAAMVVAFHTDCGTPAASSRMYDCVIVIPLAVVVGHTKLCVAELYVQLDDVVAPKLVPAVGVRETATPDRAGSDISART